MKHRPTLIIALMLILVAALTVMAQDDKKTDPKKPDQKATEITWLSFDDGLNKAEAEGKHVFINFTTSWCGWCKKMNKTTFKEPSIIQMLDDKFVSVKVDGDSKHELDIHGYKITEQNLTRGEFGVRSYPTYYFLTPDGGKVGAARGYQPKDQLAQYLTYVADRKYDTTKVQRPSYDEGGSEQSSK
jgi:thioredoxin-related protein